MIIRENKVTLFSAEGLLFFSAIAASSNKALQLTQKASFVLCIALRFIFAQNKGHFLGI
jgi:hypothetical protein